MDKLISEDLKESATLCSESYLIRRKTKNK